jgi:hypothetical protein
MPFTLERNAGRLVEITFWGALSLADVQALRTRLWTVLSQLEGRAVIWADLRFTARFSPEVADKLIEMLRVDNPKVERSAYPIGASAAFAVQVERIVAEAAAGAGKIATRRTFRDLVSAGTWLKEVLTLSAERERIDHLIAGAYPA